MKQTTSALLDMLRILAAMVVFISHCAQHWNQAASAAIQPFAHHAVVVFFVLSGYVIAFSTLSRSAVQTGRYVNTPSHVYRACIPLSRQRSS